MFWEITPAELAACAKHYHKRKEEENERTIIQAYMTAAWQRSKRMPDLDHVLNKSRGEEQVDQSAEQMLTMAKILNARFGGKQYE